MAHHSLYALKQRDTAENHVWGELSSAYRASPDLIGLYVLKLPEVATEGMVAENNVFALIGSRRSLDCKPSLDFSAVMLPEIQTLGVWSVETTS